MSRGPSTGSLVEGLETKTDQGARANSGSGEAGGLDRRTVLTILGVVGSFGILAYVGWTSYNAYANSPLAESKLATLKDVETGEVFEKFRMPDGKSFPYVNPKTGKSTLFPAEVCYWTKDGKAKFPPTFVILNERLGKTGPTICPDCGRSVRRFNPMPPDALMQAAWDAAQRAK